MPAPNSSIAVNAAANPSKALATYEYMNGHGDVVENEAITLTTGDGTELLGQMPMTASVPVVIASDQDPIPVTSLPAALHNGHETAVTTSAALVLAANAGRQWCLIQNTGTVNVRVGVSGVTATTGARLIPNATMVINQLNPYVGNVYAIAESGSSTVFAMEAD